MMTRNTPDPASRDNRKHWLKFLLLTLLCTAGGAVLGYGAACGQLLFRRAGPGGRALCRGLRAVCAAADRALFAGGRGLLAAGAAAVRRLGRRG